MNFNLSTKRSQKTLLGAVSAAALSVLAIGQAHSDPITVVSWGGSYGKAQDAALFTDASKNSGIEINRESGASMSKVVLQVESNAVTWDLVVSGSGSCAAAAAKGALEKIDFNVVDVSNFLPNTPIPTIVSAPMCLPRSLPGTRTNTAYPAQLEHQIPGLISGMWKSFRERGPIV